MVIGGFMWDGMVREGLTGRGFLGRFLIRVVERVRIVCKGFEVGVGLVNFGESKLSK